MDLPQHSPDNSSDIEPVINTFFRSTVQGIDCALDIPIKNPDHQATFEYSDAGDWETDHKLHHIVLSDLPTVETTRTVRTIGKHVAFPEHDYYVEGMPWELFITNCHNRPTYELLKRGRPQRPLKMMNWDTHEDMFNDITPHYTADHNGIENWILTSYYFGLTDVPHYFFDSLSFNPHEDYDNDFATHQIVDVPIADDGAWHAPDGRLADVIDLTDPDADKLLSRNNDHVVHLPYIHTNTPADTSKVVEYYRSLLRKSEPKSIWLSLDADAFSLPYPKTDFDTTGFRAELLRQIIEGAYEFADRIALVTFARSPDYTGDVAGVNAFFVETLKALA